MATDNLARLSRRLLASPLKEGGEVFLFDKDYIEQTATPEPAVRDQINGLIADIRSFIERTSRFRCPASSQGFDFPLTSRTETPGVRRAADFSCRGGR